MLKPFCLKTLFFGFFVAFINQITFANPGDLQIDVSGKDLRKTNSNGLPGEHGENARLAPLGESAGSIILNLETTKTNHWWQRLFSEAGVVNISGDIRETPEHWWQRFKTKWYPAEGDLVINARGGDGGDGGDAGRGQPGGRGNNGLPATKNLEATNGKNGGDGGDAGEPSIGGNGGNGGRIIVRVSEDQTPLLPFIKVEHSMGLGGFAGKPVPPEKVAKGGEGGKGGAPFDRLKMPINFEGTVIETRVLPLTNESRNQTIDLLDFPFKGQKETVAVSLPAKRGAGLDGLPGRDGRPSRNQNPKLGKDGRHGILEFHVMGKDGKAITFYEGGWMLVPDGISFVRPDGAPMESVPLLKPGEEMEVVITVKNIGVMPSPANKIQMELQSSDGLLVVEKKQFIPSINTREHTKIGPFLVKAKEGTSHFSSEQLYLKVTVPAVGRSVPYFASLLHQEVKVTCKDLMAKMESRKETLKPTEYDPSELK